MPLPVTLIFDIGKTNKKIVLFDEDYNVVYVENIQLKETTDEDGFPCEDVQVLTDWIKTSFQQLQNDKRFKIKAVNFSAYGASFVYLNNAGKVFLPLYNYLKPYPENLLEQFYNTNGGKKNFATQSASPVLGSLNSGMQLYRLKYEKPDAFKEIKYALHLPQYLSYILSLKPCSEITSIGCHTNLWNFKENKYHSWVEKEGLSGKFPSLLSADTIADYINNIPIGVGLHDSSAALIPYLKKFTEPFILLSTGTWCISLNPFNHATLTNEELQQDCLCYLLYTGKPVKASRLFAGNEHEKQTKKLSVYFSKPGNFFEKINVDIEMINQLQSSNNKTIEIFQPENFETYEEAYHNLIFNIMQQQVKSIKLVQGSEKIKYIFVDGGFSKNKIYMNLLRNAFPDTNVDEASIKQASALGGAIMI